jgi:hypothetical protein
VRLFEHSQGPLLSETKGAGPSSLHSPLPFSLSLRWTELCLLWSA